MIERNLDGCYFGIERDGKFENLCFTDLTVCERHDVLDWQSSEWLKSLCLHLAKRLRAVGDDLDLERVE